RINDSKLPQELLNPLQLIGRPRGLELAALGHLAVRASELLQPRKLCQSADCVKLPTLDARRAATDHLCARASLFRRHREPDRNRGILVPWIERTSHVLL